MSEYEPFDFWYAVNNTEILQAPSRRLETFGTTIVNYYLLSELMDEAHKIRVRQGRIEAAKPQIIIPNDMNKLPLEGFSDAETQRYANWISEHMKHLRILEYGFSVKKEEVKSYILSDRKEQVIENIQQTMAAKNDPMATVIMGVDKPWEVCLLKLMVDLVERSALHHVQDFQERSMLPRGEAGIKKEIEDDFLAASKDASRIGYLHKKLLQHDLFNQYEDRFFALVKASGS